MGSGNRRAVAQGWVTGVEGECPSAACSLVSPRPARCMGAFSCFSMNGETPKTTQKSQCPRPKKSRAENQDPILLGLVSTKHLDAG